MLKNENADRLTEFKKISQQLGYSLTKRPMMLKPKSQA